MSTKRDNQLKANDAHDRLAALMSEIQETGFISTSQFGRLGDIYDDMTPMFCDIVRADCDE